MKSLNLIRELGREGSAQLDINAILYLWYQSEPLTDHFAE